MELRKGKGALGKMAKTQLHEDQTQQDQSVAIDPDLAVGGRERV